MKKNIFLALFLLCAGLLSAQSSKGERDGFFEHFGEFGIYYSQCSANRLLNENNGKGMWHGVGLYCAVGDFDYKKMSFFFDFALDIGWHRDIIMLNIPLALNFGYSIYYDPAENKNLMAHVGAGYMYASIRDFDNGFLGGYYVYDDECLQQHSAVVPIGLRFYYKGFFADFTYRVRFLKSKVSVHYDDDDDLFVDYDYDMIGAKSWREGLETNVKIRNIDVFPWTFTIGINF